MSAAAASNTQQLNTQVILEAITQSRGEARDDNASLKTEVQALRSKVQEMAEKGCGQAWQHKVSSDRHDKTDERVGALERSDSERKGSERIRSGFIAAGVAAMLVFLDHMIPWGGAK